MSFSSFGHEKEVKERRWGWNRHTESTFFFLSFFLSFSKPTTTKYRHNEHVVFVFFLFFFFFSSSSFFENGQSSWGDPVWLAGCLKNFIIRQLTNEVKERKRKLGNRHLPIPARRTAARSECGPP